MSKSHFDPKTRVRLFLACSACCGLLLLYQGRLLSLATTAVLACSQQQQPTLTTSSSSSHQQEPQQPSTTVNNNSNNLALAGSLAKLRKQLTPGQEEQFARSKPIYIDLGLSDAADTAHHLSKGYSVVAVDAFLPWIHKAQERFATEIAQNRLLLFNVGLSTKEAEAMPLYYKQEGSVIASFVKEKGCQGAVRSDRCKHTDVEVVRCEAILRLINAQVELMKVDIEMLHHTCLRGLHNLESELLPKYVCWEEHDKPFGPARVERPLTDAKLILGMYELGYSEAKIVMQGPKAFKYYGIPQEAAGFGQGSGTQTPEEMMHYRSHEINPYDNNNKNKNAGGANKNFDTDWRRVHDIFQQGIFAPAQGQRPHFFSPVSGTYYDICMKKDPRSKYLRRMRQDPESFPLASYADK